MKKKLLMFLIMVLSGTLFLGGCGNASVENVHYGYSYVEGEYVFIELNSAVVYDCGYDFYIFRQDLETALNMGGYTVDHEISEGRVDEMYAYMNYAAIGAVLPFAGSDKEGNGERQYGFFFYHYDMEYLPSSRLFDENGAFDWLMARYPALRPLALLKEFKTSLALNKSTYRTDADERHRSSDGYYVHTWNFSVTDFVYGSPTINIRFYRLNADGWYVIAVLAAAIFCGAVTLSARNKKNAPVPIIASGVSIDLSSSSAQAQEGSDGEQAQAQIEPIVGAQQQGGEQGSFENQPEQHKAQDIFEIERSEQQKITTFEQKAQSEKDFDGDEI